MGDIRARWNADKGSVDWEVVAGALASGGDLETAVLLSLFTWARAREDDILPDGRPARAAAADRKGWWGNLDGEALHGQREIGSRLWLLARETRSERTRTRAADYAREALRWLVADNIAAAVHVTAEWQGAGDGGDRLALLVSVIDREGATIFDRRYAWAWAELAEAA
ncbi:phage GP46 family protein [Parvibaculum sp.]|uniref:phage GP46 family protein n=1 Tax=Parvibaculum sp. TaxID=2024848 RepID=UPI00272F798E|nr:phage GP46 family protein [Parvibaculum sp.]MDP1628865.1 phage GP46 family protein [Parvibaculum sp.]MDP2148260.1 phage GP46 family protein [Parvibaculum sp.]MDP3327743.1 phage GP46 family protein [Parvibaculum sp.]